MQKISTSQVLSRWFNAPAPLKNYFYFSLVIMITFFIISFYISWRAYELHRENINHQLELGATRINHELKDIFNDTIAIIKFMGKDIIKNSDPNNLNYIYSVLKKGSDVKIRAVGYLAGVSVFDWVNVDDYQVINTKEGVIKTPYDMSHRSYVEKCKQVPWTLQLSKPAFGIPGGSWGIPAGVGIVDDNKKRFGIISVGFCIEELVDRIKQSLKFTPSTNFIIMDDTHEVIMGSYVNSQESFEPLRNTFSNKEFDFDFAEKKGTLTPPIVVNNITYNYYYKFSDYPYIILVGLDKRIMDAEYYSFIVPRILEFLGLGIFCLFLLYFFRKKIINLV